MDGDEKMGSRLLFDSVSRGKVRTIRFILDAVDWTLVNTRDVQGRTPLMMCCFTREELARGRVFSLLLKNGADTNAVDEFGRDVLSYACEERCNDLVRLLISYNINPEIADDRGNTPLIYSAMVGNDVAIDLLVRHFRRLGLHIDHVNKEGFTALLMAAKMGNIHCAEILVLQGKASLLHRDRVRGMSAEEWLMAQGLSLKECLKAACRAAKRERLRRVLSVVHAITHTKKHEKPHTRAKKDFKPKPLLSRSTSDLLTKPAESTSELDDDDGFGDRQGNLSSAFQRVKSPLNFAPIGGVPKGHRSASLCVPTLDYMKSSSRSAIPRHYSMDSESGLVNFSRRQLPIPVKESRKRSEEKPDFKSFFNVYSDNSDSSTDVQTLSTSSVEKLEEDIASLFQD